MTDKEKGLCKCGHKKEEHDIGIYGKTCSLCLCKKYEEARGEK